MNPNKLADLASKLKDMVEEGDTPETIATIYPQDLRKRIKKAWPLLDEHLETVEEKLQAVLTATDELFHQLDILNALSVHAAMLEAAERAEQEIEVVDAHPLPDED
jgi:polyhydroxyalkanoate synthesis regulator phasin